MDLEISFRTESPDRNEISHTKCKFENNQNLKKLQARCHGNIQTQNFKYRMRFWFSQTMCEMLMIQYPHMKGAPLVLGIPTNYDVFMISYPHTGGAPLICVLPTNQPTNQPRNARDLICYTNCDIRTRGVRL